MICQLLRLVLTALSLFTYASVFAQNASTDAFNLDGEWKFFWQELLTDTTELSKYEAVNMQVPDDWYDNHPFEREGYGTYYRQIKVSPNQRGLGIYIPHLFSSYKLIVNGEVLYESGKVGQSREEYTPYREPVVIHLPRSTTGELDIFVQSANFDHLNSGMFYSLVVGDYYDLQKALNSQQNVSVFLAGGFFITGILLLVFSLVYRQLEVQIPFYAIVSLSLMYRMVGSSPYPLHAMLDDYNFFLAIRLEYLTVYTSALFGGLMIFSLFPKQTIKPLNYIFYAISVIGIAGVFLLPPIIFTSLLKYYMYVVLVYMLLFIYTIAKAKYDDEPTSGYLIAAMGAVFVWLSFQMINFLNVGHIPFGVNIVLISLIILLCNLALLKTFLEKINRSKLTEAEVEFQRSRQIMLSLISHEIKMPVAKLQMNMEMMKMSKNSPEKFWAIKDKLVDTSYEAVDSIKLMLNDFLYFMSGDQKVEDDLNVQDLQEYLQNNWKLPVELSSNIPTNKSFSTSRVTLRYILNTLVGNAIKYSRDEDRKPEFVISSQENRIILELKDFGIGIDKDRVKLMGQKQTKVTNNSEISGMGFYLANELSTKLKHSIWVTSRGSEGTSIFLAFDLHD